METRVYTLITGASSGLGKEFAIQCARLGMHIIMIALPGGNMISVAGSIAREYGVSVQVFEADLTDTEQLRQTMCTIMERYPIRFLINNAGTGGTSPIMETPLERIDRILLLNVRSTVLITRMLIPHLQQQERSYILNISSMAAFTPIAYKTVYPASKAFIASFSLGLREELSGTGLSVSVAYPGPIMTNSGTARRIIAQGFKGRLGLLSTPCIARMALERTLAGDAEIIPGLMNRFNHFLMGLLPKIWKLRIVSKEVKKEISFSMSA